MKPTFKTEIFPILLLVISAIASVYFYFNLPPVVATHWNFAGQPDAYGSGKTQAMAMPLVALGMYLLFWFLPYLDPKKQRYEQFARVYRIFRDLILALLVIVFFIVCLNGLGYNLPVGTIVPGLIGLLFIALGNYMGKIKMNWFVGIRTPWTLSSEEVWNKTHRFGGKMFILAGLLMIAEIILPLSWKLPVFIFMMIVLLFGTMGYSYFVFRQEKNSQAKNIDKK